MQIPPSLRALIESGAHELLVIKFIQTHLPCSANANG
jgi:hypothetical protein